jgi:hypothetical protein
MFYALQLGEPEIKIQINYTDMMWGLELMRHIEGELAKRYREGGVISKYFKSGIAFFAPIISLVSVAFGIFASYDIFKQMEAKQLKAEVLKKLPDVNSFQDEVLLRLQYLMSDGSTFNPFMSLQYWLTLIALLAVNLAMWLYISQSERSYLILNSASQREKEKDIARTQKLKHGLFLALIVGATAGFLGNKLTALYDSFFS